MPKKRANSGTETLSGIVTPIEWDDDDQVTAVALSATDDEQYWIENSDKFIDLSQKCIEASGKVNRDRKSTRSISIKRFSVIENY